VEKNNRLDEYNKLAEEWLYMKRDPDTSQKELDDVNQKLIELWKDMTVSEHYLANNYIKHLRKR